MAEGRLNSNAPLMSTRRLQTTAVSVRRNKKKMIDDSKTTRVCRPDIDLDQITEPSSVPLICEQIPGRLADQDLRPENCESRHDFDSSKLSQGKLLDILKCPSEPDFEGEIAVRTAIDRSTRRFHGSGEEQVQKPELEDEDNAVFSDALDTLSAKGSCSEFRSGTGVSGYGNETKTTTRLSEDPQSRDFMLNRFLPAAKAMILEQPQYATKKQPSSVMSEPTRLMREIVAVEKRPAFKRYESTITQCYHRDVDNEESEEDEDEDEAFEFTDSTRMTKRGCGLLPQLCFRNSLGMLNTVPALKAKANINHNQGKSTKVAQLKSQIQSVKKIAMDSVYKQKEDVRARSPMHQRVVNKLNSGSEQFGSNPAIASRSSSPYRRSAGCMSPYRSAASPHGQVGFRGTLKEAENLRANRLNKHIKSASTSQELLYPKSTRQGYPTSCVAEKRVYIDTENSLEFKDQKNSSLTIIPETKESSVSCTETVSEEADAAGKKLDAILSVSSGKTQQADGDELEKIKSGCELMSSLAPPLPKKPSEPWLLRNLPSVNPRISSRGSAPFHPQKPDPEEKSNGLINWETIVKTSYLHKDHIRYSEELVTHTSHESKT